jgi:DNA-directed RNA polymerase specialized sigma24 family protein
MINWMNSDIAETQKVIASQVRRLVGGDWDEAYSAACFASVLVANEFDSSRGVPFVRWMKSENLHRRTLDVVRSTVGRAGSGRSELLNRMKQWTEDFPEPQCEAKTPTDEIDELDRCRTILGVLSEPFRTTMSQYYIDGLSMPEIADMEGVGKTAISMRIKKANQELLAYWGGRLQSGVSA